MNVPLIGLSAAAITSALSTRWAGRTVHFWPSVGSTNDELKRLAEAGAPEGTLAIADEQVTGRGRLERKWLAPPGSSLLMSLLFRPTFLEAAYAQQLTMLCSLAVADAVTQVAGLWPDVKWPNDLQLGGKKLAGVLTELGFTEANRLAWVIVGVGLNVNVDFAGWPRLAETAVSLSMALRRPLPRLPLLVAFLDGVETRYEALRAGQSPHHEWAARLVTLGKACTASTPDGVYDGLVEGVDESGALLLRQPNGHVVRVLTGDVTLGC
jgi:BirA family biotin operon repressor/biotin-[acetyl-CoA-carboxylase] ligase